MWAMFVMKAMIVSQIQPSMKESAKVMEHGQEVLSHVVRYVRRLWVPLVGSILCQIWCLQNAPYKVAVCSHLHTLLRS